MRASCCKMNTFMKVLVIILNIFTCMSLDEQTSEPTDFFVLCDDNNTCSTYEPDENSSLSTEDEFPTMTTETNFMNDTIDTTVSTTPKSDTDYNVARTDIEDCPCDLQLDYCDINCCCDVNCTGDQKLVFAGCDNQISLNYDSKYCHSTDYRYINHTKVSISILEHGLFCIVSSNLPAQHIVQPDKTTVSLEKIEKVIFSKYKWPKVPHKNTIKFSNTLPMQYGQRIWLNFRELELVPFSLPINFISNTCTRTTDVYFLKDVKTSCSQWVIDESNSALNAGKYFSNITVLSLPKLINNTLEENYLQECPKNICLPINVFSCDDTLNNCDLFYSNDTRINVSCHLSIFSNEQTCLFVTKKIKYIFYHNGTFGLLAVDLYLHLTNLTIFLNDEQGFIQHFEVKFQWHNYANKVNFSSLLSGNPGYGLGRPVLLGYLNDTSKLNESMKPAIQKHDYDIIKNLLVLPKNVNDYCVLTNDTNILVEFGYNVRLRCVKRIAFNETNYNATDLCTYIQQQIFYMWQIDSLSNSTSSQKFVGMFGNSNRQIISEWSEIVYKFEPRELFEKITGNLRDDKLICQNIAQILTINIIYAYLDFDYAEHQAKILSTFFELGETVDLIFDMVDDNTLQLHNADVHLTMEVMFFDVSYKTTRRFVDPPTFQIKLPHDFFYPFTFGGQNKLTSTFYVIFIVLCIIVSL